MIKNNTSYIVAYNIFDLHINDDEKKCIVQNHGTQTSDTPKRQLRWQLHHSLRDIIAWPHSITTLPDLLRVVATTRSIPYLLE